MQNTSPLRRSRVARLHSWPRRSRVAGPRARSRARTAHRDLKEPYEHVRDPHSGVVMLRDVRDWIAAAQGACSRRMAIAKLAHEALHAEHSRQASEAAVKLEGLDREVEQLGLDAAPGTTHRGIIRDLHAAQRELAKLDEHMPATPPSPRPAAFEFEAPTIHVEPTNVQRGGTSPRRARIAQARMQATGTIAA